MLTADETERLIGATVLDPTSDRIGEVCQVFVAETVEEPSWVGVRVGLQGTEVLVPLEGADWDERALHAAVSGSCARTAPAVDLEEPLSEEERERVCRHYGIPSIRHPRGRLDPALFEDGTVSYSVKDVDMVDDDREQSTAGTEQQDLGRAMRDADEERLEGVSGHMLAPAPAPAPLEERRTA